MSFSSPAAVSESRASSILTFFRTSSFTWILRSDISALEASCHRWPSLTTFFGTSHNLHYWSWQTGTALTSYCFLWVKSRYHPFRLFTFLSIPGPHVSCFVQLVWAGGGCLIIVIVFAGIIILKRRRASAVPLAALALEERAKVTSSAEPDPLDHDVMLVKWLGEEPRRIVIPQRVRRGEAGEQRPLLDADVLLNCSRCLKFTK